ncbi:MAG TPA: S8 family serine peptidase [Candidatus Acidoferrales bacterium]|nr:S8 family serine peptidase [Candidatus Acidoferrales bacterium]
MIPKLASHFGTFTIVRVALCVALLTGCSGGGGSSVNSSPTSPPNECGSAAAAISSQGMMGLHFPAATRSDEETGLVAVRFARGQISTEALAKLSAFSAHQLTEPNAQGAATFSIPIGSRPEDVAAALQHVRGVLAAGPVVVRHALTTPDDPLFSNSFPAPTQWDFFTIGMPNAWGITEGSSTVRIAIIDTGYDFNNPDLVNKVLPGGSIVYDQGTGLVDTRPGCDTAQDKDGHGSDVSGIAAAQTDNATLVAGVGWNSELLEARVFPYGNNTGAATIDIAAGINWAVENGASVINLSLGGATPDPVYEEPAVAQAISDGVVVVAAAGNDGTDTIDYPAADPGVIAVGASANCNDTKNEPGTGNECVASYSNYGSQLSVVAPGGDPDSQQQMCTTEACIDFLQWIENLDSTEGPFNETVGLFAGTSQATPHVTGTVALMFAIDPTLTPPEALSIIKSSADNIDDPHQGSGRLDSFKALQATP